MSIYRYLGTVSNYGPYRFEGWGKTYDLPDDVAARAISYDIFLLPEDQFVTFGFTSEELKLNSIDKQERVASTDFKTKRAAAWAAFHAYKESLVKA